MPEDRIQEIIATAEQLLRRHGLLKTNVVDVARALGLSHAAVYRYFPTKAALWEAVARQWLARVSAPLGAIAHSAQPPEQRLRIWLHELAAIKRKKVLEDPDLFAAYHALAESAEGAVSAHVEELTTQVVRILEDGAACGEFQVRAPRKAAQAVLQATLRFHHPYFVRLSQGKTPPRELDDILDLLLCGLRGGAL